MAQTVSNDEKSWMSKISLDCPFRYLFIIIYLTSSVEVGGKPVAELEHIRRGSVLAPYSDQEISESVTGVVTVRRKMKSCDTMYVNLSWLHTVCECSFFPEGHRWV